MGMENRFYTYAYFDENHKPYYIGKGSGRRAWRGSKTALIPSRDRIIILKSGLTEKEAFKHETYMIYVLGRKIDGTGILENYSMGPSRLGCKGNFREGTKHSQKTKDLIGSYHRGKITSEETKEKLRAVNVGKKWWNNGSKNKHCRECPGAEWVPGRIKVARRS